jgi:hypothetical protein
VIAEAPVLKDGRFFAEIKKSIRFYEKNTHGNSKTIKSGSPDSKSDAFSFGKQGLKPFLFFSGRRCFSLQENGLRRKVLAKGKHY